ncbi:MAG TPA: cytochrome c maturation protein CcmE [Anaerolineaceae bacterium]|nr:cytochrome c maturation protein CcmE [Anaerolineaceae bacterium]HPN51295.1 cytochrome c maturation protein CcmE [Anaerolineaceae bacterium]
MKKPNIKIILGMLLIAAALAVLIGTATQASAQQYLTVEELQSRADSLGSREVQVMGSVVGDTIAYDGQALELKFTVAHIPLDDASIKAQGGMAAALEAAAADPQRARLQVVYHGVRPDQLKPSSQAIITGTLGADGVFTASRLLFKCPSKYEEAQP